MKLTKNIKGFILASIVGVMVAMVLCLPLAALNTAQTGTTLYATTGSQFNASAKTNVAIIGNNSTTPNAQALITYVNATVDGAVVTATTVGTLELYTAVQQFAAVPTNGFTGTITTSNYFVDGTNSMAIGTNIVIEHLTTNGPSTFEFAQIFGLGSTVLTNVLGPPSAPVTNFYYTLTNTTAAATTVKAGDIIWVMAPAAQIPLNWALGGTTNLSLSGLDGIYSAPRGSPILATCIGTTNGIINCLAAKFVP